VVELSTTLAPGDLLRALQGIEVRAGRRPSGVRWGPRPLDLDLLFYEDRVIREAGLEVPHPRLHERRFVLEPLAELAPDLVHPVLKQPIRALLDKALNCSIAQ
jgi:2-amino-4-hydroxy-6-hydroxymethyldihydropteridine diphosphokinase